MSRYSKFISGQKNEIIKNLFLIILITFIVIGELPVNISEAGTLAIAQIITLAAMFVICSFLNIYILIPRFLLPGRYFSYISLLITLIFSIILTETLFNWALFQYYPDKYNGFFSEESNKRFFLILFNIISSTFYFGATSLFVFFSYLRKSGDRIRELEETSIRVDLEKARNKIDSAAMFEVLDKAAVSAVSSPQETSGMLMELSKSLRKQLYESEYKSILIEKTKRAFVEKNFLLNFLIEKRYVVARNIIFMLALGIICFARSFIIGFVFLIHVYLNTCVLLPRLFFKNKLVWYIIAGFIFSVFVFLLLTLMTLSFESIKDLWWLYLIINAITTGLLLAGSTAFTLFQRWARNERYIAQLEATTMRAELEQLQNQINPHFLFNMLNNILVLIQENKEEAVIILQKLSDMLKYQFNDTTKKEVLLKDDIQFLNDFLNLEKIRRDHFEFTISVESDIDNIVVPPLLFIPFVENAVKHSGDAVNLSYINLSFNKTDNMLIFKCINSISRKPRKKNEYNGLGLANIKRRLELLYDENHSLKIQEDETSYTVNLSIMT